LNSRLEKKRRQKAENPLEAILRPEPAFQRKDGHSKLVFDKDTKTIVSTDPHPAPLPAVADAPPEPVVTEPPLPMKRPKKNSPKARDERMKGRFPFETTVAAGFTQKGEWIVDVRVPWGARGFKSFQIVHSGIHQALEILWGRYSEWVAQQAKEPT